MALKRTYGSSEVFFRPGLPIRKQRVFERYGDKKRLFRDCLRKAQIEECNRIKKMMNCSVREAVDPSSLEMDELSEETADYLLSLIREPKSAQEN